MKTLIQTVWQITEEYDKDSRHIAYYTNEPEALKHKGNSPYLSCYQKDVNIIILDSFEEFKEQLLIEKKLKALAKLSEEEKVILGFKE